MTRPLPQSGQGEPSMPWAADGVSCVVLFLRGALGFAVPFFLVAVAVAAFGVSSVVTVIRRLVESAITW